MSTANMKLNKVLLVEDESDIRLLVTMALSRLGGMDVHAEPSGRGAWDYLAEGHRPELIVLDMMMPDMDGLQTFAAIRKLPGFAKTAICFLTAKLHPAEVKHWRELGICDVLAKPFSPSQLPGQLQACWQRWHQMQ